MRNAIITRALTFVAVSVLVLSQPSSIVHAADRDFSLIVDHIKRQYHTKPKSSFLMAFAGLAVKFARPAGVKSMKLAIFDDLGRVGEDSGLDEVLRTKLSGDWHPIVKVRSRKDGSETHIFTREAGKDFELLIVSIDGSDGTVLKAKVDPETLAKWVDEHEVMGHDWTHDEQR